MAHSVSNMVLAMRNRYQVHSLCSLVETGRQAHDDADITRVLYGMEPMGMLVPSYGSDCVAYMHTCHGMKGGMKSMCACGAVCMNSFGVLPCMPMQVSGRHISGNMYCRSGSTSPAHPCRHDANIVYCHNTEVQVKCMCASCGTWAMHMPSCDPGSTSHDPPLWC